MSTAVDQREAIVDVVTRLSEQFRYEMPPHELRTYVEALADIPLEHLEGGCRLAIQSRKFMPMVSELRVDVDAAVEREDVQARADRLLSGVVPAGPFVCEQCANTTWVIVSNGDQSIPGVRRCFCVATNPTIRVGRRYAVDKA
jgi:hypothetical protein